MSEPRPEPPTSWWRGFQSAFFGFLLGFVGFILLLPGLYSLVHAFWWVPLLIHGLWKPIDPVEKQFLDIWIVGLISGALGVAVIILNRRASRIWLLPRLCSLAFAGLGVALWIREFSSPLDPLDAETLRVVVVGLIIGALGVAVTILIRRATRS